MKTIPEEFLDLLERNTFAHFASKNPDGTIHVIPVWIDVDGDHLLVNTTRGFRKEKNSRNRPIVSLSILDPDMPYRHLYIQGEVDEITSEGAVEHNEKLAKEYLGTEFPSEEEGDQVLIKITPVKVSGNNFDYEYKKRY